MLLTWHQGNFFGFVACNQFQRKCKLSWNSRPPIPTIFTSSLDCNDVQLFSCFISTGRLEIAEHWSLPEPCRRLQMRTQTSKEKWKTKITYSVLPTYCLSFPPTC